MFSRWRLQHEQSQRDKGRRGQLRRHVLQSRDWSVAELNGGSAAEDFVACDLNAGKTYSDVEAKEYGGDHGLRTANAAMEQAKRRRAVDALSRWPAREVAGSCSVARTVCSSVNGGCSKAFVYL